MSNECSGYVFTIGSESSFGNEKYIYVYIYQIFVLWYLGPVFGGGGLNADCKQRVLSTFLVQVN